MEFLEENGAKRIMNRLVVKSYPVYANLARLEEVKM
jgi:hypothetical protein